MDKKMVESIWYEVSENVKDEVVNPTVFEALEHAIPIDIQGDTFILGFAPQYTPLMGYVTGPTTLPIIERCLAESMKMEMKVLAVEGETLEEYEAHKRLLEQARKIVSGVNAQRSAQRKVENDWEAVGEKCIRTFTAMENKGFAINKAKYLHKAFDIIDEMCQKIDYRYQKDALHDRCLSRLFDRLETAVELPGGVLAFLFFQYQENKNKEN